MTFATIRDHDHDLDTVRVTEQPDLGGRTVVEECEATDCQYWRSRWEETATLDDFGEVGEA